MSGLALKKEEPEMGGIVIPDLDLSSFLGGPLQFDSLEQTEIPRLARNPEAMDLLEKVLLRIPTNHYLVHGDAREMRLLAPESAHLVLTSPPYWTLKKYDEANGQLGHVSGYEEFLAELGRVWRRCFDLLLPGGRLVCVVGDVCLSRRQNDGRHTVVLCMRRSRSFAARLDSTILRQSFGTRLRMPFTKFLVEEGSSESHMNLTRSSRTMSSTS